MNYPALLTYVFLAAYTPGPNNIMAMTNSIRFGFSRAMVFCLGLLVGFFVSMGACALATTFLFEHIPTIEPVMRWVGAGYILYLAVSVFRDKRGDDPENNPVSSSSFANGFIMQMVNVKVILYGVTTFSTFILPHHRSVGALALTALFLSAVGSSANTCWALFGSLFQNFHAKHRKGLNAVMALLLVYCAVGIVVG